MTKPRRHKWGDKIQFPLAHKTERTCQNGCGLTKVSRHETEGGRDVHWTEFWRGGEQVHGEGTPVCETVDDAFMGPLSPLGDGGY